MRDARIKEMPYQGGYFAGSSSSLRLGGNLRSRLTYDSRVEFPSRALARRYERC
jgi:hypothetical protein